MQTSTKSIPKRIVSLLVVIGATISQAACSFSYKEEALPVPKALAEARIIVFSDAYVAKGPPVSGFSPEGYGHLPVLGKIEREIVHFSSLGNIGELEKKEITDRGRTLDPLPGGTELRVSRLFRVTEYGYSSGGGNRNACVLILNDKAGLEYQINTSWLWSYSDATNKPFLEYVPDSATQPADRTPPKFLSSKSFKKDPLKSGPDDCSFIGPVRLGQR